MFICRFTSNLFENGLGFQLEYEPSDVTHWSYNSGACGGTFKTPNGILTSPSYPGDYPYNAECIYTISRPTGTVIVLNFLSMDLAGTCTYWWCDPCDLDYLEIRDGSLDYSPLLHTLCGTEIPDPIHYSHNQLQIK